MGHILVKFKLYSTGNGEKGSPATNTNFNFQFQVMTFTSLNTAYM